MQELVIAGMAALAGKVAYDIAGPLAKELGEMLKEEVQPYRAPRRKRLLEKTAAMLRDGEIRAHAVPGRILFPILEYASHEDDDDLHSKWAALLAHAASVDGAESYPTVFTAILSELSPREVLLLDTLLRQLFVELKGKEMRKYGARHPISPRPVDDIVLAKFPGELPYQVAHDHLSQRGLMRYAAPDENKKFTFYYLTTLGLEFTAACQPPPKAQREMTER